MVAADLVRLEAVVRGVDWVSLLDRAERLRPRWMRDALCREPLVPRPEFFPARGVGTDGAKAVCRRCLVRGECAEFALGDDELFGVWGGTSFRERAEARREGWSVGELLGRVDGLEAAEEPGEGTVEPLVCEDGEVPHDDRDEQVGGDVREVHDGTVIPAYDRFRIPERTFG